MRFTDVRHVAGQPADVWQALHDREVLRAGVPGRLIELGDDEYVAILADHAETYRGLLCVVDRAPGSDLTVQLAGRGRCGTLEVALDMRLRDGGVPGTTALLCDVRVHVDGVVAVPGQASPTAEEVVASRFFADLDDAAALAGALA